MSARRTTLLGLVVLVLVALAFFAGLRAKSDRWPDFVSVQHPSGQADDASASDAGSAKATDSGERSGANGEAARKILYWVAPMDPDYRRDGPGKSPMGMDLVPVYADAAMNGAMDGASEARAVQVSPAVIQNLGVRVAKVEVRTLTPRVRVAAQVMPDADRIEHIHVRTDGWIENLYVHTKGEQVKAGQRLFRIYSPALVGAQQEYLQATRGGHAMAIQAATSRLEALGMRSDQIAALAKRGEPEQRVDVRAERAGFVQTLNVREGMFVGPGTTILSVVDLSEIWVEGAVPEREASRVGIGRPATAVLAAEAGNRHVGQVDYVYPMLDLNTHTLRVRTVFPNPDLVFKPGMFATLEIEGPATGPVPVVPASAVIRAAGKDHVVLALGDGRFRPAEVRVGPRVGEWMAIEAGLAPGESVVVSGQFLLDSEASRSAGLMRLLAPDGSDIDAPASGHIQTLEHAAHAIHAEHASPAEHAAHAPDGSGSPHEGGPAPAAEHAP